MSFLRSRTGLIPEFPSPVEHAECVDVVTEEAGLLPPLDQPLRVTTFVQEGDRVARGAAIACLRQDPDISLVAPIAGRIGRLSLLPGRKLSEIVVFGEDSEETVRHDTSSVETGVDLRRLLQAAGFWPRLRRRPFGGMPTSREVPSAVFVMASDTRPYAPNPQETLKEREAAFERGLAALQMLAAKRVFLCVSAANPSFTIVNGTEGLARLSTSIRHPQGMAGIRMHHEFPAGFEVPVWEVHADDVADLGELLKTGELPMLREVRIAGAGLREGKRVRTHPGADLRQLVRRIAAPGPHRIFSGSHLDGHPARWLDQRHRQVTVLPTEAPRPRPHWLVAALTERQDLNPAIPTAALDQSLGGDIPAIPFIRALGAGDDETAMDLGLLSLLEDDVALADYTLGADGRIKRQLRAMLERIRAEHGT